MRRSLFKLLKNIEGPRVLCEKEQDLRPNLITVITSPWRMWALLGCGKQGIGHDDVNSAADPCGTRMTGSASESFCEQLFKLLCVCTDPCGTRMTGSASESFCEQLYSSWYQGPCAVITLWLEIWARF
eukprot:scaffold137051_cov20-Tisochrysis_lutea.AAC.1